MCDLGQATGLLWTAHTHLKWGHFLTLRSISWGAIDKSPTNWKVKHKCKSDYHWNYFVSPPNRRGNYFSTSHLSLWDLQKTNNELVCDWVFSLCQSLTIKHHSWSISFLKVSFWNQLELSTPSPLPPPTLPPSLPLGREEGLELS
jgi:hypothetical protein